MGGAIWIKDMPEMRRSEDHRQNLRKDEEIRKEMRISGREVEGEWVYVLTEAKEAKGCEGKKMDGKVFPSG